MLQDMKARIKAKSHLQDDIEKGPSVYNESEHHYSGYNSLIKPVDPEDPGDINNIPKEFKPLYANDEKIEIGMGGQDGQDDKNPDLDRLSSVQENERLNQVKKIRE
jgi:hypothetical protein